MRLIQFWNDSSLSKWQNFHFWVNCSFNRGYSSCMFEMKPKTWDHDFYLNLVWPVGLDQDRADRHRRFMKRTSPTVSSRLWTWSCLTMMSPVKRRSHWLKWKAQSLVSEWCQRGPQQTWRRPLRRWPAGCRRSPARSQCTAAPRRGSEDNII